jgi:hypothetical protein
VDNVSKEEQKVNGFNMIKVTCLFPLAQSPGLGSLESLQAKQRLNNDRRKQENKQQMKKVHQIVSTSYTNSTEIFYTILQSREHKNRLNQS